MNKLQSLEAIVGSVKETLTTKTKFKFMCYTDGIFCYGHFVGNTYYEMNMICDDTLMREMSITDLLNIKRLTYVSYYIYSHESSGHRESEGIANWSVNSETSMN